MGTKQGDWKDEKRGKLRGMEKVHESGGNQNQRGASCCSNKK